MPSSSSRFAKFAGRSSSEHRARTLLENHTVLALAFFLAIFHTLSFKRLAVQVGVGHSEQQVFAVPHGYGSAQSL